MEECRDRMWPDQKDTTGCETEFATELLPLSLNRSGDSKSRGDSSFCRMTVCHMTVCYTLVDFIGLVPS